MAPEGTVDTILNMFGHGVIVEIQIDYLHNFIDTYYYPHNGQIYTVPPYV